MAEESSQNRLTPNGSTRPHIRIIGDVHGKIAARSKRKERNLHDLFPGSPYQARDGCDRTYRLRQRGNFAVLIDVNSPLSAPVLFVSQQMLARLFDSDPAFGQIYVSTSHLKVVNVTIRGTLQNKSDFDRLRHVLETRRSCADHCTGTFSFVTRGPMLGDWIENCFLNRPSRSPLVGTSSLPRSQASDDSWLTSADVFQVCCGSHECGCVVGVTAHR